MYISEQHNAITVRDAAKYDISHQDVFTSKQMHYCYD